MKKAFTLIELLVVIAIIAILAAILFPVFAQAKAAAKDSANLSNVKQLGTANLMYATDVDDLFPLHTRRADSGAGNFTTWQYITEPYKKNSELMYSNKLPRPQNFYHRVSHYGLLPRAESKTGMTTPYFTWSQATLTAGRTVQFQGVAGAGLPAGETLFTTVKDAPSMSTSEIAQPSTMIMLADAGRWEMAWVTSSGAPMTGCSRWNDDASNIISQTYHYRGPHARKTATRTGLDSTTTCYIPNGMTNYVATDSSAKAVSFRGEILKVEDRGNGVFVHPRMFAQ